MKIIEYIPFQIAGKCAQNSQTTSFLFSIHVPEGYYEYIFTKQTYEGELIMSDERKYYEPFFKAPSNMYYYNIKRLFSMYGQQKLYRVDNMWINPYGKYGEYACV